MVRVQLRLACTVAVLVHTERVIVRATVTSTGGLAGTVVLTGGAGGGEAEVVGC